MRIEQITLHKIAIPLVLPLETSMGRWNDQHTVLVRIQGEGLEGWGESPVGVFPDYNHETSDSAVYVQRQFLAPPLFALDITRVEDLHPSFRRMRGHPFAKAGLEWATLDWLARAEGVSLSQKLGGVRQRVPVGVSLGIEPDLDQLMAHVDRFVALGYQRIKLKIKPGWDVQVAAAMRSRHPHTPFMLDANNAYTLDDLAIMQALDAYEPMMIEQPLAYEDIYFHSLLQRQLRAPISLDESIHTPQHAQTAIALQACGNINIKPGRLGGPSAAVRVHDICQEAGMPVWHGGMLETGIGRAANLAMASLPNFVLPGDLSASDRYFKEDVVDPPARLNDDGTVDVPTGPGLGVAVRLEMIERFTLDKIVVSAT